MQNVALHGIKSNVCPRCEVPIKKLGSKTKDYRVRDYARYQRFKGENRIAERDDDITPASLGICFRQNVFYWLPRLSPSDPHKPDMPHTIYLGIFKHMMKWIQGFMKKNGRLDGFDEVWKTLPPYPGFLVPKEGYHRVTQWQGKEMTNMGLCILGILRVALCQPRSSEVIPFKHAPEWVQALAEFNMMAQYRSHMSETIACVEDYLDRFHKMKNIILEYRVTKCTEAKIDEQRKKLRHHSGQTSEHIAPSKWRRNLDADWEEHNERHIDMMYSESHFNFIKIHLISHFSDDIRL